MQQFHRYKYNFDQGVANYIGDDSRTSLKIKDIQCIPNFISAEEEEITSLNISYSPWDNSQSNIKKQEYGPTIDFTTKNVDYLLNTGLPRYSRFFIERLQEVTPFLPDRQRILEVCRGHDTPKCPWIASPYHTHKWVFGDKTIILCLLSNITICLDKLSDDPTQLTTRIEVSLSARSLLLLSGDAANLQVNVDDSDDLSRCLLLVYNSIIDSSNTSLNYFRSKYIGISNHEFTNYADNICKNPIEPLMVNTFSQHHIPIEVIQNLIEHNFSVSITKLDIIDGYFDTNISILTSNQDKLWAKLAICSIYINENSLDASCAMQNWIFSKKCMDVPNVLSPQIGETQITKGKRTQSLSKNDFCISIERDRVHLLWVLSYIKGNKLQLQKVAEIKECLCKIRRTIQQFHKCAEEYILEYPERKTSFVSYLTFESYKSDLDVLKKKVFMCGSPERQKLLACCLHYFQQCLDTSKSKICKSGIIHTYFNTDCILCEDNNTYSVLHFVNVRFGFYLTDMLLATIRLYISFKCQFKDETPPFNQFLSLIITEKTDGNIVADLDKNEQQILYPLLLCLGAVCMIEICEQVAIHSSNAKDLIIDKEITNKLNESVEVGYGLLEQLCYLRI